LNNNFNQQKQSQLDFLNTIKCLTNEVASFTTSSDKEKMEIFTLLFLKTLSGENNLLNKDNNEKYSCALQMFQNGVIISIEINKKMVDLWTEMN
jgi:hypothetical protein